MGGSRALHLSESAYKQETSTPPLSSLGFKVYPRTASLCGLSVMTQAVTFSSPLGLTILGTTQLGVPCSLERGNSSELLPGKSSNSSGCTEISLQHSPIAPDNTPTPALWGGGGV